MVFVLRPRRRALAPAKSPKNLLADLVRRAGDRRYRSTYAGSSPLVPSREELPIFLNRRGLLGRGVEVGVFQGAYSAHLLSAWRGRELVSVDPWEGADEAAEQARRTLARFGARSVIWRSTSLEAAEQIEDASLDFVYIDALHDYDSVREDLEAWYPKVRGGGILAGHDYFDRGSKRVKAAVDDFALRRRLAVSATWRDRPKRAAGGLPVSSWFLEIPRNRAPLNARRPTDGERQRQSAGCGAADDRDGEVRHGRYHTRKPEHSFRPTARSH
jgi:predicted O-methyltransferase YrrM